MDNRHPNEAKEDNSIFRPSYISLGDNEKEILEYLKNHKEEWFYKRSFSKQSGIPKTTVYDTLINLERKGLVEKLDTGNIRITLKGEEVLKCVGDGVAYFRSTYRQEAKKESLSTHYFKYSVNIKDLDISKLETIRPKEKIKENKLVNFTEYYLYFDDCTITIKKNQAIIHIHDIITSDINEAHWEAFNKGLNYLLHLKKVCSIEGLIVFGKPHYARVESYLSEKLMKIDNKYFLSLGDGTKFWIDYSDKREDETDNPQYRERLDNVFLDMKDSKAVFSDVDKHEVNLSDVKEISKNQVIITNNLLQLQINQLGMGNNDLEIKKKDGFEKPLNTYFG